MNTDIIKSSECRHTYWDEGRCTDCGKTSAPILRPNIWANFDAPAPAAIPASKSENIGEIVDLLIQREIVVGHLKSAAKALTKTDEDYGTDHSEHQAQIKELMATIKAGFDMMIQYAREM